MKKTKIICTIGPASLQVRTLKRMHRAGMNGARINTAYGTFEQYRLIVDNVRKIADIPIIIDLKGPEIRLRVRQRRTLSRRDVLEIGFNQEKIAFSHDFYDLVGVDDQIYIDNGKIRTQIVEKDDGLLRLSVTSGGEIRDGVGVNIPHKRLSVPTLSHRDLQLIGFAEDNDVDYVALSFTRNAGDVKALRSKTHKLNGEIIAKIENVEGVENFDEILDSVQSVMVARGDLGVEIKPEKVPLVQKSIIRSCNRRGKGVIVATEMLESMMHQPIPTRAEVSDVANAILDGTDAVMLSGETSIGKYAVESVSMMSRIAGEIETVVAGHIENEKSINISDTVSRSIQQICQSMPINKVVTLTRSGYTARMIARFKIQPPIIAVTPTKRVKRRLELTFGVTPIQLDYRREEDRILSVAKRLRSMNLVSNRDIVLFTAAFRTAMEHASNLIEIHSIGELVDFVESQMEK